MDSDVVQDSQPDYGRLPQAGDNVIAHEIEEIYGIFGQFSGLPFSGLISHNSLAGEDDPEVLRQMLESLLPLEQAYAAVLDMEVPKPPPLRPSIGTPDTVTVAVTFTPPDVEEIRRVADLSLFAQIEPLDQMRDFLEAVFAVKLQTTSTNRLGKPGVLTTMARLSQWALENGYLDSERGKDSRKG